MKTLAVALAIVPTLLWASSVGPQCNGVPLEPLAPFLFVHVPVQNQDPMTIEFETGAPVNKSLMLRVGIIKMFFRNNQWEVLEGQEAYGPPFYLGVQGPSPDWFVLDPDPHATWQAARVSARRVICSLAD